MSKAIDGVKLSAARLWAAHHYPYFAAGLFAMVPVALADLGSITVDTHWRLYVDPEVTAEWPVPVIGAVLIHNLTHLLRDHARRAEETGVGEARTEAWNTACDAEINDDLVSAGLSLPGTPVTPGFFGWPDAGLAETYFNMIRTTQYPAPAPGASDGADRADGADGPGEEDGADRVLTPGPDCGSGAHGRRRPWEQSGPDLPGVGPGDAELLRRRVARAAVHHARVAGKVPEGWLRWAETTLRPVVDWRRILAAEIRRGLHRTPGCVDFTFSRRSRRASVAGDVILPGVFRPAPELAVVVDTSGSMDETDLEAALAEVDGILGRAGLAARRVPVLACDAAVGALTMARRGSDVVLTGEGGTDMGESISAAAQLHPRPQAVVVLTDGFTPWPCSAPRGISVIVGLIGSQAGGARENVPHWARAVVVGEPA